jgi:enoyl-CoA hydratase
MTQEFSTLSIERDGPIVELTLCRPDLMNRIDALAHRELVQAFRAFEDMDDVRAIVFAAQGNVFSAGGDFELMLAGNADLSVRQHMVDEGARLLASLLDIAPPIVVALEGSAIGLGATLALSCDAVVSCRGCRVADPHVAIGLVAGDGGGLAWPQSIGMLRAKRYLLTGDSLKAEDAYAMGLVTDLVDTREQVLPAARDLARRLAALPPLAVQGTKRALNAVLKHRYEEVMKLGLAQELVTLGSDDLKEAISAFKEKRPARFQNR